MRYYPLLCCLAIISVAGAARAEEEVQPRGFISVQIENDMFGDGSDRHYTHGTQISYATPAGRHKWVAKGAHALHLLPRGQALESRVTLSLGQAIYTPADISRLVPDPLDRPYAGWLYLNAGLIAEPVHDDSTGPSIERTLHKVEFSVGIVGPASLAEQAQKNVHEWIGAKRPRGWDYQLKNEPALLVSYEYQHRYGVDTGYLEFDATPHASLAVGNVFTQGAVGFTLRVGHDMLQDFGPPRIRPGTPGSSFFQDSDGGLGWYLFAGFEGRAVARNIFLDGNTFVDGPHVDKQVFVGDLQVGLAVTLGRARLSFTNVYRTREFSGQPDADDFGSISASFRI